MTCSMGPGDAATWWLKISYGPRSDVKCMFLNLYDKLKKWPNDPFVVVKEFNINGFLLQRP